MLPLHPRGKRLTKLVSKAVALPGSRLYAHLMLYNRNSSLFSHWSRVNIQVIRPTNAKLFYYNVLTVMKDFSCPHNQKADVN